MQPDSLAYQAVFFPNLNISRKHRQIGGQSVRFALHERFSIAVGCRFAWRKIPFSKGSGSSDVYQVSVGRRPYKSFSARPIVGLSECSLSAPTTDLTCKCLSVFQWLTAGFGSLRQHWPCKHFMQHFPSLPDFSYVAAESRTTTSICSEECCTGVDLAMTSKPICLKPSTQAATGQRLLPTNLDS